MSYRDVYIAEQTMFRRVEENQNEVEVRRLIRQFRGTRPGRLSRAIRSLICEVGYRLVVLGAWLERVSSSQSPTLEGNTG